MPQVDDRIGFVRGLKYLVVKQLLPAVMVLALPTVGYAQDGRDVTLRFANGQDSMFGTLVKFEDNKYFVEASIGTVVIPAGENVTCVGGTCPEGSSPEAKSTAVTLTSPDGTLKVSGNLLEIQHNEYVVETLAGLQRIKVGLVNCEGEACVTATTSASVDRTIELTNGALTLRGELLGYEDGSFNLIEQKVGEIWVKGDSFTCTGAACP